MATKDDEKRTPEDLFHAYNAEKAQAGWNLVRTFRVNNGQRGSFVGDWDPSVLPDIRTKLAERMGPGVFDLELAAKGKNTKGAQCRVDIELDLRTPGARAGVEPAHVWVPPSGGGYPPMMMAPQQDNGMVAILRAELAELRSQLKQGQDNLTQQLLRDMLTERNRAGAGYLLDQRATFEQAFALGMKARGVGGGAQAAGSWDNPRDVAPLVESAAKFLGRLLEQKNAPASSAPAEQQTEVDQTAALVGFIKTSIQNKVPATAAVAQVKALLGEKAVASLVEQRHALVEHFFSVPDMQPLLADQYAQEWLTAAVAQLDEMAGVKAEAPTVEAQAVPS